MKSARTDSPQFPGIFPEEELAHRIYQMMVYVVYVKPALINKTSDKRYRKIEPEIHRSRVASKYSR
jgi:hypothetical protein